MSSDSCPVYFLKASGTDASFDAVISLSTLAAAAVSLLWHLNLEGWLGAAISVVILKAGVELLWESLNGIIGVREDPAVTQALREKICSFPEVQGAYDLTLHRYGPEKTIGTVHIEVPDSMTARELHTLTRSISAAVFAEFGILLTVGIYAANRDDERSASLRSEVEALAEGYPEVLQVHGFYLSGEHVSFDLVMAFGSDVQRVYTEIRDTLQQRHPDYRFDIVIDSDFSD